MVRGARLIDLQGRKYKLWWPGNQDGNGGVGVLVKGELYDNVVEVRGVNDRVISLAIVLEDDLVRVACACAPLGGRSMEEKQFFMKIYQENGPPITRVKLLLEWEILADMLAKILMDFRWFMEDLLLEKEIKRVVWY